MIALAAMINLPPDRANADESANDCKQYDFVSFLPPSFKEAGNGAAHQAQNADAAEDVFMFASADCVCTNRVSPDRHLDFPGTPLEATLTCGTRAEWTALKNKTRFH